MTMLSVENLTKQYGGRKVVNDVSLTVDSGSVIGLLGPNGAGKTTTFYLVVGMVRTDGGRVAIG
nr:ATP-binding cassette domain-containing protein [Desulfobacterales bacterium]